MQSDCSRAFLITTQKKGKLDFSHRCGFCRFSKVVSFKTNKIILMDEFFFKICVYLKALGACLTKLKENCMMKL